MGSGALERSFFFNDTATTEIYTLSLHDALPIFDEADLGREQGVRDVFRQLRALRRHHEQRLIGPQKDRKSTRLNSSHSQISYAVFCLKKKNSRDRILGDRKSTRLNSSHLVISYA